MKEDIVYGRGSDRKYVIQRRFNYSETIKKYLSNAKHIQCDNPNCKSVFEYELLTTLQLFDMLCPKCKQGTCAVEHVVIDVPNVDEQILIPEFDLNLLNSLKIEEPQYPTSLSQELDCTYQKVSRRAIKLKELGFIKAEKKTLDKAIGERTYYTLNQKAYETYFTED